VAAAAPVLVVVLSVVDPQPLLPLATGAAILRYRLYDLDRIIGCTLAYGLLTLLLGGGYAGMVLGLGQLLGRGSSLIVAMATLAVALVFQPARRRVQRAVDRATLTGELLAVVEQTMQPTQASLWLRQPARRSAQRHATDV
jgi:hypothetical protein